MKKVAISQSNYIPWKGYFDLIKRVDEFVIYDEMQYTKNDWRNRNQIKYEGGLKWLTIPVKTTGRFKQKINETFALDNQWRQSHWDSIKQSYRKAPFFKNYEPLFKELYLGSSEQNLSQINIRFLKEILSLLEIDTKISYSKDFKLKEDRIERLIHICHELKADIYLSSSTAKNYVSEESFKGSGIQVEWLYFRDYPKYEQLYGVFTHHVSILDLIFHEGPNAKTFIESAE